MRTHAYRHGYALGAFAIPDLESLVGVIAAAEAYRAPVLLVPEAADEHRRKLLLPAVEAAARDAQVPVGIQAAVAGDREAASSAIRLGCNGLRVRETGGSFPQSVQQAQEIAALAHACGLSVEAEPGTNVVTTPAEAKRFVEGSGVEGLWLDLGVRDSERSGKGRPDYDRVKRIHKELNAPLGIDAGNGLSEDQYLRLIRHGVAVFEFRAPTKDEDPVAESVSAQAEQALRIWGAAGRAAEVRAQCAPWEAAEQILLCNFPGASENEMDERLSQGELTLAGIPGVRDVVGGKAAEEAPYRYAWRVRLCHPKALSHFQQHPERHAFTHGGTHSSAEDCIWIHYRCGGRDGGTQRDPQERPFAEGSSTADLEHVAARTPRKLA
ncbi:class II fructose-bisphosphate aldolase [Thiohalorhabdus denitrificans]|nr:class II fructose-bisphosphate aldolase [Thiohalorhabdus denitrificans]